MLKFVAFVKVTSLNFQEMVTSWSSLSANISVLTFIAIRPLLSDLVLPGLCLTWLKTQYTVFLETKLICIKQWFNFSVTR